MKGKLIALLAVLALASGMGVVFAFTNPSFFGTPITGPTVTVTAPTPFTLAFGTTPPTSGTLGAQSYASVTVANTNGKSIAGYALFVNFTGTGVTPSCVSSGTCAAVTVIQVGTSSFGEFMFPCFGPPCPTPNATPQEDLYLPMTVPAGTTLTALGITYGSTGTFVMHVAVIFAPTFGLQPSSKTS